MSAMVSLWLLVVRIAISLHHNAHQMLTNSAVGFIGYGVGLHMDGVGGHGAWQWYVIKPCIPETKKMLTLTMIIQAYAYSRCDHRCIWYYSLCFPCG